MRSSTTSSPPRPRRQRGVGKVRRTTQQKSDGARRSCPVLRGSESRRTSGPLGPKSMRRRSSGPAGCAALSTIAPAHDTAPALPSMPSSNVGVYSSNEGRVAMSIRQNPALGVAAFAAVVLACSERPDPVAPLRADATALPETHATTYSGRATVVQATLLGLPTIPLVDAGPLPSSGGAEHASLVNGSVPGLLTVEVLHAATVGQGNASRPDASVAELALTVGGNSISAGVLEARAAAMCTDGGATASGSSHIARLSVNGHGIQVDGTPNQTVPLLNGTGKVRNKQQE